MLNKTVFFIPVLPLLLNEEKVCHNKSFLDGYRIVRDTVSIPAFL